MPIKRNPIQEEARRLIRLDSTKFFLGFGGTGSGKTFGILDLVVDRALAAPGSKHAVFRSTRIDAQENLWLQTYKKLLEVKWPTSDGSSTWEYLRGKGKLNYETMTHYFDNGSEITFGGLDDNKLDRTLGADYLTIFINEISEINSFKTIDTLRTRLRQKVRNLVGKQSQPKFIMDCNPPSKRHWSYAAFYKGVNPNTGLKHRRPEQWVHLQMNTHHNADNLVEGYEDDLHELGHIEQIRFLKGDWYDDVDNPLFYSKDIIQARLESFAPPTVEGSRDCDFLTRIEVAIDPAVSTNAKSDETGIVVVGRDDEGHGYVLEDISGKHQPAQWGEKAVEAYHRWKADAIIAEKNQGGDLVESNIRQFDPSIPIKLIHASRGKELRADAASTAYKQLRIHHCGKFDELENQMLEYEIGFDRRRKGSPDRLDALVHGLNSILLGEPEKVRTVTKAAINGFWRR